MFLTSKISSLESFQAFFYQHCKTYETKSTNIQDVHSILRKNQVKQLLARIPQTQRLILQLQLKINFSSFFAFKIRVLQAVNIFFYATYLFYSD